MVNASGRDLNLDEPVIRVSAIRSATSEYSVMHKAKLSTIDEIGASVAKWAETGA
jgi:hypothetical protein